MNERAAASETPDVRSAPRDVGVAVVFFRIVLGALFLTSAWTKFKTPLDFAFAIKAFHLGFDESAVVFLAYAIPWSEILIGAMLVFGFFARPAAATAGLLMLLFIGGIVSLRVRGLDVACPCFGTLKLFCSGPMGTCHIVRNAGIALVALFVVRAYGPSARSA